MKQSVVGFRDPFADEVVREVAIIADRDVLMTALHPRIMVVLHHVAVDAGLRIVAQVTRTFAVTEGEGADTGEDAQGD